MFFFWREVQRAQDVRINPVGFLLKRACRMSRCLKEMQRSSAVKQIRFYFILEQRKLSYPMDPKELVIDRCFFRLRRMIVNYAGCFVGNKALECIIRVL